MKFEEARTAGKPVRWTEFRKSECGIEVAATAKTPAAQPAVMSVGKDVTFPSKIDGKFASETPTKQRMKTCLEAYRANKGANTLGGLRWVQKGGGYYSLCSAKLKASSAQ